MSKRYIVNHAFVGPFRQGQIIDAEAVKAAGLPADRLEHWAKIETGGMVAISPADSAVADAADDRTAVVDYEAMLKGDLVSLAENRGIKDAASLTKADLVESLQA